MTKIDDQTFIQAYELTTSEQDKLLIEAWMPQAAYTAYVAGTMMPRLAKLLNCRLILERNRIDYMLVTEEGKEVVAIEHENNVTGATRDVECLARCNMPLGVLITFISDGRLPSALSEFGMMLKTTRMKLPGLQSSQILLIVGPYGFARPTRVEWKYFLYDGNEFRRTSPDANY